MADEKIDVAGFLDALTVLGRRLKALEDQMKNLEAMVYVRLPRKIEEIDQNVGTALAEVLGVEE